MFDNSFFQPYWGEFRVLGTYNTTTLPITEADANHPTASSIEGKLVDLDHAGMLLQYTTGRAYAIMERRISLKGIKTDEVFFQSVRPTRVYGDVPIRKGLCAEVRVYEPNSLLIFEGLGVASVDNNVVTSGTGALSAGTLRDVELSCIKGGWRVAQTGELVLALFEHVVTPVKVAGNLRIMVKMVSPYKKA